jgi:phosphoribosylglycinamide formyltransferase-1
VGKRSSKQSRKQSLVVLISGSGSNLQAIIDAVKNNEIDATISAVISNKPAIKGLERAASANINTIIIDHSKFDNREEFDNALSVQIATLNPDLIILAGFMRILNNKFIDHYKGKTLNIHPSLLPEFKGLNTHRRAIDSGKTVHGASVHFVSNELDSGPVIIQAEVPVLNDDDEKTLARRVLEQEHKIYPTAIKWFIEGRLALIDNQAYLDKQPIKYPVKWTSDKLSITS